MEIVIRTNLTQSNNVHPLRNAEESASGKGNLYTKVHMTNSYKKGSLNGHGYMKDSGKIHSCGSACGYSFITKKGELFGKRHIYYTESDKYLIKSMDNYNTLSLREISELCVNKDEKVIHSQGKYINKNKIY